MSSNKDKGRTKSRARRGQEAQVVEPTEAWLNEYREEVTRRVTDSSVYIDLERAARIFESLERRLFWEKKKPTAAAEEAFLLVVGGPAGTAALHRQAIDPDMVQFSIREEGGVRYVTIGQFQVRIWKSADGDKMEYSLDGLEGCDLGAFDDIVRLAREAADGEYYLHGAAVMEWWRNSQGSRPTFEQLATASRQLYRNEGLIARFLA